MSARSLLRICGSLLDPAERCEWALLDGHGKGVVGSGALADLPRNAGRVQFVIPAGQVLLTRTRLPHGAKRRAGSLLAFAVEEKTATDPDANQVSWLGMAGEDDALAVVDKVGLERWRKALELVGMAIDEIHCEILYLPIQPGEWSLAWNGREGFVRRGEFAGAATDCGDREEPPLLLRLMLEEAKSAKRVPSTIALVPMQSAGVSYEIPDIAAWQKHLDINLRLAATIDWRSAPLGAGVCLTQQPRRWRIFSGMGGRLRPAAWILGSALALHAIALVSNWSQLADEQRSLRQKMETHFRATFPDAVAVVDPALQMHRKLVEARRNAGLADSGDFLPMISQVAVATKDLPSGSVRAVSYESGRIQLELSASEEAAIQRIVANLRQAGFNVERAAATNRGAGAAQVLTVRTS